LGGEKERGKTNPQLDTKGGDKRQILPEKLADYLGTVTEKDEKWGGRRKTKSDRYSHSR